MTWASLPRSPVWFTAVSYMARVNFPEISLDKFVPLKRLAYCVIRFTADVPSHVGRLIFFFNDLSVRFVIAGCVWRSHHSFYCIKAVKDMRNQWYVEHCSVVKNHFQRFIRENHTLDETKRLQGKPVSKHEESNPRAIQDWQYKIFLNEDFELNARMSGVHISSDKLYMKFCNYGNRKDCLRPLIGR